MSLTRTSFSMHLKHRTLTWTLTLLSLGGVLCITLRVKHQQQNTCVVIGSSVVIPCSFSRPDNLRVKAVLLGHRKSPYLKGCTVFSSNLSKLATRFQHICDKHHNCSLKINQVEHDDTGEYLVRFNKEKVKCPCKVGPLLEVVDLNILVTKPHGNGTTKEGSSVNLTCVNSCDGGHLSLAFTWFKNGEPINEGAVLYLSNLSSTDSGNYTCSLRAHTRTTSGIINIDVEYGPKNTSGSVRPSVAVDAGSNITLICSSRANPPVENCAWFKLYDGGMLCVGNEPELHMREVSPAVDGQYLCSASNKHGSQNSSVVTLKVNAHFLHSTFTRDVFIMATAATVTALVIVTTVTAIRGCTKKRTLVPEAECADIQTAVYLNWPMIDNSQSCEGATLELIYTTIEFSTKRESSMQQQMDSHLDEGLIYSAVRR